MYNFEYFKPTSIAEAASLYAAHEGSKLLAGGQSYLPALKMRLDQPSALIDLGRIEELKGIREEAGGLTFGAMTRHSEVKDSELVRRVIPALSGMCEIIGDPQVRHLGTIGGSISNNDPSADYPAALVALKATIRTNIREIPAEDFFLGMFETALEPGEITTAVHFPKPEAAQYMKFRHPASRYAMAGVFVAKVEGTVRVTVVGAGYCVFRATAMEEALTRDFSPKALDAVTVDTSNLNSDIHGSAEYRANLVKVMAKRAVEKLV